MSRILEKDLPQFEQEKGRSPGRVGCGQKLAGSLTCVVPLVLDEVALVGVGLQAALVGAHEGPLGGGLAGGQEPWVGSLPGDQVTRWPVDRVAR